MCLRFVVVFVVVVVNYSRLRPVPRSWRTYSAFPFPSVPPVHGAVFKHPPELIHLLSKDSSFVLPHFTLTATTQKTLCLRPTLKRQLLFLSRRSITLAPTHSLYAAVSNVSYRLFHVTPPHSPTHSLYTSVSKGRHTRGDMLQVHVAGKNFMRCSHEGACCGDSVLEGVLGI